MNVSKYIDTLNYKELSDMLSEGYNKLPDDIKKKLKKYHKIYSDAEVNSITEGK